jgi:hypothetical protein
MDAFTVTENDSASRNPLGFEIIKGNQFWSRVQFFSAREIFSRDSEDLHLGNDRQERLHKSL